MRLHHYLLFLFCIVLGPLCASPFSYPESGAILYQLQLGNIEKAFEQYRTAYVKNKKHDVELLQKMSFNLMEQGAQNKDPEIQLLALFGAGISAHEHTIPILEGGLDSEHAQLQLVALRFLSRLQNDAADVVIQHAMSSPSLLVRLEGAHCLATKHHPATFGQLEALMQKVDPALLPIFPQLFALLGDRSSMKVMRQLMNNQNIDVQIETILSAAKYQRDDLLMCIRTHLSQHHAGQQEACAVALGELGDAKATEKLRALVKSPTPYVKLGACIALQKLGHTDVVPEIIAMAKKGDPFAITVLGTIPGHEDILATTMTSTDPHVRMNSAMALLERSDPRCLLPLCDLFLHDARDIALVQNSTPGRALHAWKVVFSAREKLQDTPMGYELSCNIREEILAKTIDLPERHFLELARVIFMLQQNDLVPTLVELLEKSRSPACIDLLKEFQQQVGTPYIRDYCTLALYRLHEPGPYQEQVHSWLLKQQDTDLIRFRPMVPWELSEEKEEVGTLTPQHNSRLFVESVETLASRQDDEAIDILIQLIQKGNPKNRYALVGLLVRATE